MARYVVMSFKDNEEAERFVAAVARGAVFLGTPDGEGDDHYGPLSEGALARAMYMQPTQFCSCGTPAKGDAGFTRGTKYGLWVHSACGKPTKLWAQGDRWYTSLGKNLLPIDAQRPEWRGEGVYMHRWDPATSRWVHVITGEVWNGEAAATALRANK